MPKATRRRKHLIAGLLTVSESESMRSGRRLFLVLTACVRWDTFLRVPPSHMSPLNRSQCQSTGPRTEGDDGCVLVIGFTNEQIKELT